MILRVVALFIFVLSFSCVKAEKISFKNFPIETPLAYRSVTAIGQDNQGYIWFGSSEGLFKYDGYQYKRYETESHNSKSLSSNIISQILLDKQGRLWVATRGGGVNLYDENSDTFTRFKQDSNENSLSNDFVNSVAVDKGGKVWVGTESGISTLKLEGNAWHVTSVGENLLSAKAIETIAIIDEKEVWISTNEGDLYVFNLQGEYVRSIVTNFSKKTVITSIFQDKDGLVWLGTNDSGLMSFNRFTLKLSSFPLLINQKNSSNQSIEDIFQDRNNTLWIASDKGLTLVDLNQNTQYHHSHSISNVHSLANDIALTIYEDNTGIVWVGTFSGVSRWNPNMTMFKQYLDYGYPELASSLVMDFLQFNDDAILFNTYEGKVYQYNEKLNTVQQFLNEVDLSKYRLTAMFLDKGLLYIGTRSSGLLQIDVNSKKLVSYSHDSENLDSISANGVTDINKDDAGNIWVSTFLGGLNLLTKDGKFENIQVNDSKPEYGPNTNNLIQIQKDHLGRFWLATYGGGINLFDPKTRKFKYFVHDDSNQNSLSGNIAWVLFQDRQANIWIGTQGAGLSYLTAESINNNQFNFERFLIEDGLKDQTIYSIVQDGDDNVWFSSNRGIGSLNTKNMSFTHFDTRHGLSTMEYNHAASFKSKSNELFFGSTKGVTSVNPGSFVKHQIIPEVRLRAINKSNETIKFDTSLSELRSITFDYKDQLVSFEYVGLNYSEPNSTNYQYRLLGFDEEWVDAGKLRRATYTNLPHGDYIFQVKASNADGQWSEPSISLKVVVTPAPWNTWWAFLAYSMFLALALLLYSRYVNSKLVTERNLQLSLKKQIEDKTRRYLDKNQELEQANKQLEKLSIIDNATGLRSRRYLDIYIEQAVSLMHQMHQNIAPAERASLPRLFLLLVQVPKVESLNSTQLLNFTDLLKYSSNPDDLIVRWSEDCFAVIGYEKDNAAKYLASKLRERFKQVMVARGDIRIAYSYYPFSIEQPLEYSWEHVSSFIEHVFTLTKADTDFELAAINGLQDLQVSYTQIASSKSIAEMKKLLKIEMLSGGS